MTISAFAGVSGDASQVSGVDGANKSNLRAQIQRGVFDRPKHTQVFASLRGFEMWWLTNRLQPSPTDQMLIDRDLVAVRNTNGITEMLPLALVASAIGLAANEVPLHMGIDEIAEYMQQIRLEMNEPHADAA